MPSIIVPDYGGGSIVNLMAELETRLTGDASSPGLHRDLAALIPERHSYILMLFDGLGDSQLDHPAAADLAASRAGMVHAPFPSTTTVSLASVATGLPPSQHGLLGYQLWLPEVESVVNTIKWTKLWGEAIEFDTTTFLPSPSVWERLVAAGREPITIQPSGFEGSHLTKALYRGCRFEGVVSITDLVEATVSLARVPGRLVFVYVPHVDFAAHVSGQNSAEYADAMEVAAWIWDQTAAGLSGSVALIGTADHGHIDFPPRRRVELPRDAQKDKILYGDGRAMFVRGDGAELSDLVPATWFPRTEMDAWWGGPPHHESFEERAPDGVLVADDDHLLLHRHSDDRLVGNHGALTPAEIEVPLLVATSA